MVQTIAVDVNNDLYLNEAGNIAFSYNLQAVLELCEHAMKTRLGECVLNTDEGLPYFEVVFNGVPNLLQFEGAAREALIQIEGVTEIVDFVMTLVDNTLQYTATIKTIYGQGAISG